jgi:hypothetical protein
MKEFTDGRVTKLPVGGKKDRTRATREDWEEIGFVPGLEGWRLVDRSQVARNRTRVMESCGEDAS